MAQRFLPESQEQILSIPAAPTPRGYVLRETLAACLRHRRLIAVCFGAVMIAAVVAAIAFPKYESTMEIIVKKGRVDPLVSVQQNAPPQYVRDDVTEAEVNSEVEVLKSDDLLRQVVQALGPRKQSRFSLSNLFSRDPKEAEERRIALEAASLKKTLKIDVVKKSRVIQVSYQSRDPKRPAAVLNKLSELYIAKHISLRQAPGQLAFFEKEAARYRAELQEAERALAAFGATADGIAPAVQRENTLRNVAQFETEVEQSRAAIAETQRRIDVLERQLAAGKPRIVTQVKSSDNPQLLQQLKSTLLDLQLKRTELLTKFTPEYRLVKEADAKIAETLQAIAAAESKPLRDETSDRDPTFDWIRGELAKERSQLRGLQARARSAEGSATEFRKQAHDYDQRDLQLRNLLRGAKSAEERYLLYEKKSEEARLADAMDRQGIANVAVVQAAFVPQFTATPRSLYLIGGFLLALFISSVAVFGAEYLDDSFHSREQVEQVLQVPVLAAVFGSTELSLSSHAEPTPADASPSH